MLHRHSQSPEERRPTSTEAEGTKSPHTSPPRADFLRSVVAKIGLAGISITCNTSMIVALQVPDFQPQCSSSDFKSTWRVILKPQKTYAVPIARIKSQLCPTALKKEKHLSSVQFDIRIFDFFFITHVKRSLWDRTANLLKNSCKRLAKTSHR